MEVKGHVVRQSCYHAIALPHCQLSDYLLEGLLYDLRGDHINLYRGRGIYMTKKIREGNFQKAAHALGRAVVWPPIRSVWAVPLSHPLDLQRQPIGYTNWSFGCGSLVVPDGPLGWSFMCGHFTLEHARHFTLEHAHPIMFLLIHCVFSKTRLFDSSSRPFLLARS